MDKKKTTLDKLLSLDQIPPSSGKISTLTVRRDATGVWRVIYVISNCQMMEEGT